MTILLGPGEFAFHSASTGAKSRLSMRAGLARQPRGGFWVETQVERDRFRSIVLPFPLVGMVLKCTVR
jgi:hypothetical protein